MIWQLIKGCVSYIFYYYIYDTFRFFTLKRWRFYIYRIYKFFTKSVSVVERKKQYLPSYHKIFLCFLLIIICSLIIVPFEIYLREFDIYPSSCIHTCTHIHTDTQTRHSNRNYRNLLAIISVFYMYIVYIVTAHHTMYIPC